MSGQIVIKFQKNPMQFLITGKANVIIDGNTRLEIPQSTNYPIQLETGHHSINMSFNYLGRDCGPAAAEFDLIEGQSLYLTYSTPIVVSGKGKIVISRT